MALYLIVAHQTAASSELITRLREIAFRDADAEFVLLVPATPVSHLLTWTEGEAEAVAHTTARDASRALRDAGLTLVDTVIGPGDPLRAIQEEHRSRGRPYATTVISTLPLGVSRWLRRDLPNQARTKLGIDVVHVTTREARKQEVG